MARHGPNNPPFNGPLDLGDPAARALLRRLDLRWQAMDGAARTAAIAALDIMVPPSEGGPEGLSLLPGGSLCWRGAAAAMLVCDPADVLTFDATEARKLSVVLAGQAGCTTVMHGPDGAQAVRGRPGDLPLQAATVLEANAGRPTFGWAGAGAIQWHDGGAAAWPFVPAPAILQLAASLTAVPILPDTPPIAPSYWGAATADDAFTLTSPALAERVDNLLTLEVSDALRWALVEFCTDGPGCLASRLAEALMVLPSILLPDPARRPGAPGGPGWGDVLPPLTDPQAPNVLLALERPSQPRRAMLAVRAALQEKGARIRVGGSWTDIEDEAALFAAHQAAAAGRLIVLLPPPADGPVELYGLARDIALRAGVPVLAAAPCWGFRHRIDPDSHQESGNAVWFGMGPSLDDLDVLFMEP